MTQEPEIILGKEIGHIRVVDVLAQGGMGTVYAGFDMTLQRKVALKAIRSELHLNAAAKSRFRREARLLSQLDHRNICRVLDYIESDDGDFLVLELVEGRNLRDVLASELSWTRKLEIARQLLDVLVAVHHRNVIHRDLKPDNVMITTSGDVKVLDFGLARLLVEETVPLSTVTAIDGEKFTADDSEDIAATRRLSATGETGTGLGAVIGTAGYMSPEQARGEPATAASDMYSLGLMLQELFTGKPPFASGLNTAELIAKSAAGEHLPVTNLPPDITALIERLKSLAPGARPSSLDAAEQLKRIIDRPQRRRRRIVIAAVWLALALLAGVTTVQSLRAGRAARRAAAEAEVSRQVSEFLVDLFAVSDPGQARGNSVTAREILDRGAASIEHGLTFQPETKARLMQTMGAVYTKLGLYDKAVPLLEIAYQTRVQLHGSEHPDVAVSLNALGGLFVRQGRYDEAEQLLLRAIEIGTDNPDLDEVTLAGFQHNLAVLYEGLGRYDEAEPLFETALATREALLGPDNKFVAETANSLGILLLHKGHFLAAERLIRRGLEIRSRLFVGDHPLVAESLNNLGTILVELGHYEEAEEIHRRALAMRKKVLGPDHPQVGSTLNNLALIYDLLGRQDDAESSYLQALEIWQKALGPDHARVAMVLNNLGYVYCAQGRFAEAERVVQQAQAIWLRALGPNHPYIAETVHNLANIYRDQGRYAEADKLYHEAVQGREKSLGPAHTELARCLFDQAKLYVLQDRYAEAEPLMQRALEIQVPILGPDHPDLVATRAAYEEVESSLGRPE